MWDDAEMRVLFAAPGAFGHINPMVPLARAMQRAGHEVRWVTSARLCTALAALGFDADPGGLEIEERHAEYKRRFPHEADLPADERRALMFPTLFGAIGAPATLAPLTAAASAFGPDVLVHDAAEFASALVAATRGIPHVTHSFGAVVPPSMVHAAGEHMAPLWEQAGLAPQEYGGSYQHLYVDIYPPMLQTADMSHVPTIQQMRPDGIDRSPDDELPLRLRDLDGPLVYATFGTVFNPTAVFGPIIETARELDATVVVTVGPAGDPAALGDVPPNVVVERYIPQSLLLDRCRLVISHAGSGTFLGALTAGVPQLCLPQAADQFANAAAIERIGAGIALAPAAATDESVSTGVAELLGTDSFATAARVASAAIAGMPSPEVVVGRIEQLTAGHP